MYACLSVAASFELLQLCFSFEPHFLLTVSYPTGGMSTSNLTALIIINYILILSLVCTVEFMQCPAVLERSNRYSGESHVFDSPLWVVCVLAVSFQINSIMVLFKLNIYILKPTMKSTRMVTYIIQLTLHSLYIPEMSGNPKQTKGKGQKHGLLATTGRCTHLLHTGTCALMHMHVEVWYILSRCWSPVLSSSNGNNSSLLLLGLQRSHSPDSRELHPLHQSPW